MSADLSQVDIYDRELIECPWAFFKRLREEAPVVRHDASGIYQISSYELATKALMDTANFSSVISHVLHGKSNKSARVLEVMAEGYERPATLQTADAPIHTRSRKIVNKAFTPKRVTGMADEITATVDALIDGFAKDGRVEFMRGFALPLPMTIVAGQLGVPLEDMPKFRAWSDAFASQFSHTAGEDGEVAAAKLIVEFQHYFYAMLQEKRANPTDDIISDIATANLADEGDDRLLDLPEALQIVQQVLVAGNETTTSTLGEAMLMFARTPGLIPRLKADPSLLPNAIEEVIRLLSPVQTMWRVTTRAVEIGGVEIPEGALVLIRFGAANRDEAVFADGEEAQYDRANAKRHIAFGFGPHVCIGAALARKELVIAFTRLFERIEGWRLDPDATDDFTHRGGLLLRGLGELHLLFDPEPNS